MAAFYVLIRGFFVPSVSVCETEQDALRAAEETLRARAPLWLKPGVIEVGQLVPTARFVESPGPYGDGCPFPWAIQRIEGSEDVKLRALRQGLRDVLAEFGEGGYNDGIKGRLEALLEE